MSIASVGPQQPVTQQVSFLNKHIASKPLYVFIKIQASSSLSSLHAPVLNWAESSRNITVIYERPQDCNAEPLIALFSSLEEATECEEALGFVEEQFFTSIDKIRKKNLKITKPHDSIRVLEFKRGSSSTPNPVRIHLYACDVRSASKANLKTLNDYLSDYSSRLEQPLLTRELKRNSSELQRSELSGVEATSSTATLRGSSNSLLLTGETPKPAPAMQTSTSTVSATQSVAAVCSTARDVKKDQATPDYTEWTNPSEERIKIAMQEWMVHTTADYSVAAVRSTARDVKKDQTTPDYTEWNNQSEERVRIAIQEWIGKCEIAVASLRNFNKNATGELLKKNIKQWFCEEGLKFFGNALDSCDFFTYLNLNTEFRDAKFEFYFDIYFDFFAELCFEKPEKMKDHVRKLLAQHVTSGNCKEIYIRYLKQYKKINLKSHEDFTLKATDFYDFFNFLAPRVLILFEDFFIDPQDFSDQEGAKSFFNRCEYYTLDTYWGNVSRFRYKPMFSWEGYLTYWAHPKLKFTAPVTKDIGGDKVPQSELSSAGKRDDTSKKNRIGELKKSFEPKKLSGS